MAARYPEERDYGRGAPGRDRDPRDVRSTDQRPERPVRRDDIAMEDQMDTRMDGRYDPRTDLRADPRVMDPRGIPPPRTDAPWNDRNPDRRQEEVMYQQDPRGPSYYREQPPARPAFPARDDRDDLPSNRRQLIDPGLGREQAPVSQYNEYFLPGDGIDREVIQYELCRYLGQDATCRPGSHPDGRVGFIIRAYRALTTAMVASLKEDTVRWRLEKEKRGRSGRAQGSYSEMRERQFHSMDVDDDDRYGPPPAQRPRHDIDIRANPPNRHALTPVSSVYPADSGYPAYALGPNQQSGFYRGTDTQPRTSYPPGNTTPPTNGRGQPVVFPNRTTAVSTATIPASTIYQEPPRDMYGHQYQSDPSRRQR